MPSSGNRLENSWAITARVTGVAKAMAAKIAEGRGSGGSSQNNWSDQGNSSWSNSIWGDKGSRSNSSQGSQDDSGSKENTLLAQNKPWDMVRRVG